MGGRGENEGFLFKGGGRCLRYLKSSPPLHGSGGKTKRSQRERWEKARRKGRGVLLEDEEKENELTRVPELDFPLLIHKQKKKKRGKWRGKSLGKHRHVLQRGRGVLLKLFNGNHVSYSRKKKSRCGQHQNKLEKGKKEKKGNERLKRPSGWENVETHNQKEHAAFLQTL